MTHFSDRLASSIERAGTPAVVGIDPQLELLPDELRPGANATEAAATQAIETFSRRVIDAVAGLVPAVKINSAFFEAFRAAGVAAFYRCIAHAHAAGMLVIADIKRGDIGSTAKLYARGHLAPLSGDVDPHETPDAVTLAGYLGEGAVRPFIDAAREHGRGLYVLVRPSDPGADEIHELRDATGRPFYAFMAERVRRWGADCVGAGGLSCVGAVVAPKDRASSAELRTLLPTTPLLIPGYGAQGASADDCRALFLPGGRGAVVNASRSVIYAYRDATWRDRGEWTASIRAACEHFADALRRVG